MTQFSCNPEFLKRPRAMRSARSFIGAVLTLGILPLQSAVDLNLDGFGDVWQLKYPGAALPPAGDFDGDGQSNAAEETLGTSPYDAQSIIRITELQHTLAETTFAWPSVAGKRYSVEWSATISSGTWTSIGPVIAGTGAQVTTSIPNAATTRFFRVRISDTDSDSDGVTDWEELQLGYDPNSNAQNDLARLTTALQSPSVVSIEASDVDATEPSATTPADPGAFRILRSGGIGPITINLTKGGPTTTGDHASLPASVVLPLAVNEASVAVMPLADALTESDEAVSLSLASSPSFVVGTPSQAAVLIHDNVQANGTGLAGNYWKHPTTNNNSPYFTGTPTISRIDPTVDFNNAVAVWPGAPITSGTSSNYFSSRWTGEILPEFSQYYTLYTNVNDGGRLWVDGQLIIDNWPPATVAITEKSAVIQLEAGKRHPIVFEHFNNTGSYIAVLSWASSSQTKQVIPQARLFPNTAPKILPPLEAWAFVGAPQFSYQINASGSPTSYSSGSLPATFSLNTSTGLITGNPTSPGVYDIAITATNANGSGSAILRLNVLQASGGVTREFWQDVPGTLVTDIPLDTTPTSSSTLTSLSAPSDVADNYGVRIRGFLTAPATGEYKFFLRADEAAEFRLSDDEEPVNAWKRAALTAPVTAVDWSGAAKSPLLHLVAGQRYYLEILHKESTGTDHLSLGWSKPGEADTSPSEIVPGHVLTRFEDVTLGSSPGGTLYFAQLTPQNGAVTNAYGSGTLRLSADKTTAWVTPQFSNLGSAFVGMHIHDSRLPSASNIVFDLDEPDVAVLPDGSYEWHITDTGGLTALQIADGLGQYAYLNIHTANYPGGEIKGFFKALDGSNTFTPPPNPPDWTSESAASNSSASAASRFLQQATFGANAGDLSTLQAMPSYEAWIDAQFVKPVTSHFPYVEKFRNVTSSNSPTYPGSLTFNSWWKNSIESEDQLRQRIAFALSEILVISESGPLSDRADTISDYYDTLLAQSFGNARQLLETVTLHPAMGRYLDMLRNDKPNLSTGLIPNENYAREILQLFSLGLNRLHPDGSLVLSSKGLPIPVYDQDEIVGLAHAFTGWDYNYTGNLRTSFGASSNWIDPMREVPARHFIGKKRVLNNVVLPGITTAAGAPIDPYATHTSTQTSDPAYQALPAQELTAIHDQIFQHPNFGPFFCRQLIQRLVTSTPSRGYIYRVTSKFNDNGSGVRGDMKAVIKAILLDYEARSLVASNAPGYGKQREPVLRVSQLVRAFRPANNFAGTFSQDGGLITVDTAPTAHRLSANQKVLLGFTSSTLASTDSDYTVLSVSGTTFTVRTRDVFRSTWSSSSGVITVTTPSAHGLVAGQPVFLRFRTGNPPASAVFLIASTPTTTTFTVSAAGSYTSGECDVAFLRGVYALSSSTLTMTCNSLPGLAPGDKLTVLFTPTTGQTSTPADGVYTITSVSPTDARRYTLTPDSGVLPTSSLTGLFHAVSTGLILNRSGNAVSGYSDWNVGDTDTDLGQTPMNSPTVFNFYLPDYQFPGVLADGGLTTPEFQISSETNVIRQSNFLFGGIYSTSSTTSLTSGYTNGFSSFRTGNHDMMMDFSPWMGPRTTGTDYWTNTTNLRALIQEFSKLLMAGGMTTTMEDQIYNYVSSTSNITYSSTAPSDSERRNRIRAILYLIAISPDHAIQR